MGIRFEPAQKGKRRTVRKRRIVRKRKTVRKRRTVRTLSQCYLWDCGSNVKLYLTGKTKTLDVRI